MYSTVPRQPEPVAVAVSHIAPDQAFGSCLTDHLKYVLVFLSPLIKYNSGIDAPEANTSGQSHKNSSSSSHIISPSPSSSHQSLSLLEL
ncbi:MAG: hypothetical protein Q8S84_01780 [bacterium]|nr:hypothetical protein [bacterium]MDP3380289.1 hypothetical protein [bacterium]